VRRVPEPEQRPPRGVPVARTHGYNSACKSLTRLDDACVWMRDRDQNIRYTYLDKFGRGRTYTGGLCLEANYPGDESSYCRSSAIATLASAQKTATTAMFANSQTSTTSMAPNGTRSSRTPSGWLKNSM
jgi:hypothetical protein